MTGVIGLSHHHRTGDVPPTMRTAGATGGQSMATREAVEEEAAVVTALAWVVGKEDVGDMRRSLRGDQH